MELHDLTIIQASKKLKDKEISSEELTKALLARIKKIDKDIFAYITLTEELALKRAQEIDKRRTKGEILKPLAGIPAAVKDNILIKDVRATAASKILENYIAPYSATVIKKLDSEGMVLLGKTNMDEFAMGSSTESSAYGLTYNPWDYQRVPGGSSGGSAAAVAASECIYALGSDTGGSIRQPASFCGIVGLKPTYGRVSRFGLMAMGSSLDQIGSLTKTVEDALLVLNAIEGRDEMDSTSAKKFSRFKIQDSRFKIQNLKGIKIGVPNEYFTKGIDSNVEEVVRRAILKFEELGAKINGVSLPHTEYALACYYIIMPSEVSANLARYDGIKYGYRNDQKPAKSNQQDLLDVYLKTRQEGFGKEVRRRIMLGTFALSAGYYEAYYLKAQKMRALIKSDFEKAFEKFDLLVTPVAPTVAFKIGEKVTDPLTMYLSDIFTVPVNLAGLPAISIPCGFVRPNGEGKEMPVGLQIIGRPFEEEAILQAAFNYEQATQWHLKKPPF